MKRVKGFRIREGLLREFETLCNLLGVKQGEVVERLIEKWVEEMRGQATLDQFVEKAKQGITINIRQNQLNIFLVKLANLDPKNSLTYVRGIDPETLPDHQRPVVLETLSRILKEATALLEMARILQRESEVNTLETLITETSLKLQQLLTNS